MKRWGSLIIAVVMLFSLLTACGTKEQGSTDSTTKVESTTAASVQETVVEEPAWKTKEVKLTVWDGVPDEPQYDTTREDWKKFETLYPNIKVEHILWQPEPGKDRLEYVTAMAGGTGPSVFFNNYSTVIKNYINQGFCAPLNKYMDNWEEKDNLRSETMALAIKDEIVYGLPGESSIVMFAWNKKMFEKAGLDPNAPPKTWDDVVEFGKKLTNEKTGEYGNVLLGGGGIADWWFMFYVWQAGGDITQIESDGRVTLHLTDGPAETALKFYQDMKFVHKITEKDTLKDFGGLVTDFCQQKAAMCIFMPDWMGWFVSMGLDPEQLGLCSLPAGPSGKHTTTSAAAYATINALMSKDQQDAAWEYMKFIKFDRERIIKNVKDTVEKNLKYPRILPFKDIEMKDFVEIDPEWEKAVNYALTDFRDEYYLVESVRPYLSPAIESALADPKADVKKILEDTQVKVQKEVIDPYNANLKK